MNHPAKYNKPILKEIERSIRADFDPGAYVTILDCFGGVGGIHDLAADAMDDDTDQWDTYAVEIEREWADESVKKGWTWWGDFFKFDPSSAWFRSDLYALRRYTKCPDLFDVVATSCTYGNRMADHHEAKDASKRMTYRHQLGRALSDNNSGGMQWGPEYRDFHLRAWWHVQQLINDDSLFILNVKDHVRKGKIVPVVDWHLETCQNLGFELASDVIVPVNGMGFGANGKVRVDHERVLTFYK